MVFLELPLWMNGDSSSDSDSEIDSPKKMIYTEEIADDDGFDEADGVPAASLAHEHNENKDSDTTYAPRNDADVNLEKEASNDENCDGDIVTNENSDKEDGEEVEEKPPASELRAIIVDGPAIDAGSVVTVKLDVATEREEIQKDLRRAQSVIHSQVTRSLKRASIKRNLEDALAEGSRSASRRTPQKTIGAADSTSGIRRLCRTPIDPYPNPIMLRKLRSVAKSTEKHEEAIKGHGSVEDHNVIKID